MQLYLKKIHVPCIHFPEWITICLKIPEGHLLLLFITCILPSEKKIANNVYALK